VQWAKGMGSLMEGIPIALANRESFLPSLLDASAKDADLWLCYLLYRHIVPLRAKTWWSMHSRICTVAMLLQFQTEVEDLSLATILWRVAVPGIIVMSTKGGGCSEDASEEGGNSLSR
jgi:hypothetical protein